MSFSCMKVIESKNLKIDLKKTSIGCLTLWPVIGWKIKCMHLVIEVWCHLLAVPHPARH